MNLRTRAKAAARLLLNKEATATASSTERLTLNQLIELLGLQGYEGAALSEATYYACLKVLSESIGKLPLKVLQYTAEGGVRTAREHWFYKVLNERPNKYMTASVFWTSMELNRNHYGNAYAWIDTTDPHHPQLWPMEPSAVKVWYDNAKLLKDVPGLYYVYSTPAGTVTLNSEEVLHFKSHHTQSGLVGVSAREQLASTLQGGVKAQKMLEKMYESGMTAKAVLQYTGDLHDKSVDLLAKGVEAYAKGALKDRGVENIIPIPMGMSLTPINLRLADSQFLELRQFTALQIASTLGVKPYQVGDYTKSSYASAEAQQLSFLVDTLLFIVKQYEEEQSYKILTDQERADGYHIKFNTAVLLRADQQTQIQTLSQAVQSFLMSPNEAREKLDLPSRPGGDCLLGNGSSIPLHCVGVQYTDNPDLIGDPGEEGTE